MNGRKALELAGQAFHLAMSVLPSRPSPEWDHSTPCDGWTVEDLVNHVVGGNVRYAMILEGQDPLSVLAVHDTDVLGDDAHEAFTTTLASVTEAFAVPGRLDATVVHPKSGPMTGAQLRVLRVNELAVHGWDLARANGVDASIDEGVAEWLYRRLEPLAPVIRRSGLYSVRDGATSGDGSYEHRLLSLLGRDEYPGENAR